MILTDKFGRDEDPDPVGFVDFLARRIRIRYFFQRIRIRILPETMDL